MMSLVFVWSLFAFFVGCIGQNSSEIVWSLVSSGPWLPREGNMGCVLNNTIYVSGGRNDKTFYADLWKYDLNIEPSQRKWELVNAAPPFGNRSYHIMITHNNAMYIIAGQNWTHFYNDVWKSDDGGISWINLVPDGLSNDIMFHSRAGLAAISFNGKIYLTGGSYNTTNRQFFNDVWTSDDGTTWTLIQPDAAFLGRSGPRLAVFRNRLFLSAGEHGFSDITQYDDVWESTDGIDWKLVTRYPHTQWDKRSGHGMITDGENYLYIVGGYYDKYDLWSSSNDGRDWELLSDNLYNCQNSQEKKCGRYDFWTVLAQDPYDNNNWYCYIYGGDSDWSTFGGERDETWMAKLQEA